MRRRRFTEEQIISILKEHEAGVASAPAAPHAREGKSNRQSELTAG